MPNLLEEVITEDNVFANKIKDIQLKGERYFRFKTASFNKGGFVGYFEIFFEPTLKILGYEEEESNIYVLCLDEVYTNAILHGNKGGKENDYRTYHLQVPEDLEKNKLKNVIIDAYFCTEFYILKIIDQGDGCDISRKIQDEKNKIESGDVKTYTGRGFFQIANFVNNIFGTKTEEGFSVTIIKYNPMHISEKTYIEKLV